MQADSIGRRVRNAITLAKAALAFKIPIVVTSSQEDKIQGRIDERLQHVVPDAFDRRVKRVGAVDAWKDPHFKNAVAPALARNGLSVLTPDMRRLWRQRQARRRGRL